MRKMAIAWNDVSIRGKENSSKILPQNRKERQHFQKPEVRCHHVFTSGIQHCCQQLKSNEVGNKWENDNPSFLE